MSMAQLCGVVAELLSEVRDLRAESVALKDEIARLKGLPPRPAVKPSKPSGMEKATRPKSGGGKRRRRGAKRDGDRVTAK